MSLHKAINVLKLDSRMIEWNLKNNKLTKAELDAHLNSLPDLKDRSESVNLERKERAEIH
ncbi:MAG: hypothetical protein AB7H97_04090 [Pseudobdellovibrionaceae bacterium]